MWGNKHLQVVGCFPAGDGIPRSIALSESFDGVLVPLKETEKNRQQVTDQQALNTHHWFTGAIASIVSTAKISYAERGNVATTCFLLSTGENR